VLRVPPCGHKGIARWSDGTEGRTMYNGRRTMDEAQRTTRPFSSSAPPLVHHRYRQGVRVEEGRARGDGGSREMSHGLMVSPRCRGLPGGWIHCRRGPGPWDVLPSCSWPCGLLLSSLLRMQTVFRAAGQLRGRHAGDIETRDRTCSPQRIPDGGHHWGHKVKKMTTASLL
jgi:hypothetical protein